MRFALALGLILAGCAAQNAARLSSPALCYVNYAGTPNDQRVATAELAARRFTCTRDDIVMGQQDYNRYVSQGTTASDAAAMYLLTQPRSTQPAPPAAPPAPINCYTAGRVTTCN
jgi:hypothetical protein